MTKTRISKSLGLALGYALLCVGAPLRAGEQVPFKGSFNPAILSSTQTDATHVRLDLHVSVQATHLGKAEGPAFLILDVTTFHFVGETTWAAANGDAVFIKFAGQFSPSATPGVLDVVETFEIVGGTGRFKGATGTGTVTGQADAVTLAPLAPPSFVGTISSPGSLK
jgi:hypothetical protein